MNIAQQLEEAMYTIGSHGLEKPEGENVSILKDRIYYLGASSSPTMIIVTRVKPDRFWYKSYPFNESERVIETWIGKDLIARGSRTHLKTYGKYMSAKEKKSLESLLKGGKGTPVNIKDYEHIQVELGKGKGYEDKDLWRAAEEYGNVGGTTGPSGDDKLTAPDYVYTVFSMERRGLEKLKRDKRFKVLKVTNR